MPHSVVVVSFLSIRVIHSLILQLFILFQASPPRERILTISILIMYFLIKLRGLPPCLPQTLLSFNIIILNLLIIHFLFKFTLLHYFLNILNSIFLWFFQFTFNFLFLIDRKLFVLFFKSFQSIINLLLT